MAVFKIKDQDFSANLLVGSYKMGTAEVVNAWTDGDGRTHKRTTRKYMTGSFDLYFRTMTDYKAFMDSIKASKLENNANYVTATLTDNMTDQDVTGYFYLSFTPVRSRDVNWRDCIDRFTVTAEEF